MLNDRCKCVGSEKREFASPAPQGGRKPAEGELTWEGCAGWSWDLHLLRAADARLLVSEQIPLFCQRSRASHDSICPGRLILFAGMRW